ncbi:MAG: hypothetical protein ACK56F_22630, partial [bacterium]
MHGGGGHLGAAGGHAAHEVLAGVEQLAELGLRQHRLVRALVHEAAVLVSQVAQRRVEQRPDHAVAAVRPEQVARAVAEEVLHGLHGARGRAQARLPQVALAHREL